MHAFIYMNCKKKIWALFLGLMLVIQANILFAQPPQTIEVGPHIGITECNGDVNPWKQFNQPGLETGIVVRYNYNTRWSFRLDYTLGNVRGSDQVAGCRPERGAVFNNIVSDLALIAEFNFFDYYTGYPSQSISPYLFGGISFFGFSDANSMLPLSEASIPNLLFGTFGAIRSIPFGFGVKCSLSKHLATTFEYQMQMTHTDMLDNVYDFPDNIPHPLTEDGIDTIDPSGNIAGEMQYANSKANDLMGFFRTSLTWKFEVPRRSHCNMKF